MLNVKPSLAAYGEREVLAAIGNGAVETLLVSESLDEAKAEGFSDRAEKFGGRVIIISTETQEGAQLVGLGSIAAILRFPLKS